MRINGKASRMRRGAQRVAIWLCGVTIAGQTAWAQPLPQPPANSDLAFRILPSALTSTGMQPEVLAEQPLIRLLGKLGSEQLGFSPIVDLDRAFDGTVVGAVLSDGKGKSSLAAYFQDQELRSQRESLVQEMESLVSDLESYRSENETYPQDYQAYIDEVRYYEPSLPTGVEYQYQRLKDGQNFRLRVTYTEWTKLGKLGPAPQFEGPDKVTHATPERAPVALNFVLAAKVADAEHARYLADKLLGEPKQGFWTSAQAPLVATLRGPWMVLSDRKENLGPFLKTLNGQSPGLSGTPRFQKVAQNIDMDNHAMMYVDVPKILKGLDLPLGAEQREWLGLLGPVGFSLTPYERSQLRMQFFWGVNAPKGSELAAFFQASARASTETSLVAHNIPWDVSNAFALDYRANRQLLNAILALSPTVKDSLEMVEDVWAGMLGIDAEAGFDQLLDGWVLVSFERVDIFANALEGFNEAMKSQPELPDFEGTGGPPDDDVDPLYDPNDDEAESSEESSLEEVKIDHGTATESTMTDFASEQTETAIEVIAVDPPNPEDPADTVDVEVVEVEAGPPKPPRLPFTMAFSVPNPESRTALLKLVDKYLVEDTQTSSMNGVEVLGRADGLLSYAVHNDWVYFSGGNTQRLLRNLLAAATGRKSSLTSLESWAQFRTGQRGRVLAIGHQKVDGFYSMVKSFLLFMGPDFRPLAKELGGLRDYHGGLFAVPDGLLMVGDILQGDEK